MPNDKARSNHGSANRMPDKRLIKAIRGQLTITNPKLGCVPASDLAEAVLQSFPKAFLDACSAQMKLTPMVNRIASEGKWLFQVPSEGLLGDRSITDCFRDLASRLCSLASSIAVRGKHEEVKERREQKQLRLEETFNQEREVQSFPESLNRKTAEELEQMKDSPLKSWMQVEITKRLNEISNRQRVQESEHLMATLNGKVICTLCEMARLHPHGWQSEMVCDRIIVLLRKLGMDFIGPLSKESGEGLQRIVDWAKAEITDRQPARESAEFNAQLHGKQLDELSKAVSSWAAALRTIKSLLPDAEFEVLVQLCKPSDSDFQLIAELAQGELIRRRQEDEHVKPRITERWV